MGRATPARLKSTGEEGEAQQWVLTLGTLRIKGPTGPEAQLRVQERGIQIPPTFHIKVTCHQDRASSSRWHFHLTIEACWAPPLGLVSDSKFTTSK